MILILFIGCSPDPSPYDGHANALLLTSDEFSRPAKLSVDFDSDSETFLLDPLDNGGHKIKGGLESMAFSLYFLTTGDGSQSIELFLFVMNSTSGAEEAFTDLHQSRSTSFMSAVVGDYEDVVPIPEVGTSSVIASVGDVGPNCFGDGQTCLGNYAFIGHQDNVVFLVNGVSSDLVEDVAIRVVAKVRVAIGE